jgi:prevent-host-death family protein
MPNLIISAKLMTLEGMQTVSATEAKQRFAAVLDTAQREPVRIQRHDRDVAVLISAAEFDRLSGNRWKEFNRLKEIAGAQARANGLTEEILAEILAG